MTKTLAATALAAVALVACSGTDDSQAPAESFTPSTSSGQSENSSPESPCPSGSAEPTGPKKTPSPVEKCEGGYKCSNLGDIHMHSDGKVCKLGTYVLYPDGRATRANAQPGYPSEGRWEGDAVYFSMTFGPGAYFGCGPLVEGE